MQSRRQFIRSAAITTVGFVGLRSLLDHPLMAASPGRKAGYGPLHGDARDLFRVPRGFQYRIFSRKGEEMDDGLLVPGMHDGMGAFAGPGGVTLLVRNHELESAWTDRSPFGPDQARLARIAPHKLYDRGHGLAPNLGGTTTLVYDTKKQELRRHFLSLAGTVRNCAGGPTPWGTWVTCEEVNAQPEPYAERPHGYNFEVRPTVAPGLVDPVPLKAMGRFRHEAIAVDPRSGAIYQTEDLGDGLLYRYLPHEPGKLARGGRLQALAFRDAAFNDTRNWALARLPVGAPLPVRWIDLDEPESPNDDLRVRGAAAGAAVFARGEGAWTGKDGVYFVMTNGGRKQFGQIFRYVPGPYEGTNREAERPGTLELFAEPNDSDLLRNGDNIAVAPWGDLIICEDTDARCRVLGVTPRGEFYTLVQATRGSHELAGACFSPDGSTLFFNVQNPGYTVALTGPWGKRLHG